MAETFTHVCIKPSCGKSYTYNDPDAYYCSECVQEKKAIAKRIDSKIAQRPKKVIKSELKVYDEMSRKGVRGFPKATDIGIRF